MGYRIGTGIDFHQLVTGRDLWIGGVKIPHSKGALGHSDADVLLHAICDALLGALGLGDIGKHFPDTDNSLKNIDSKILLSKTYQLIVSKGYKVINVDSTICLEVPKIMPYAEEMRSAISSILQIDIERISIKATTTEKMGFAGREEGLFANATVLLKKKKNDNIININTVNQSDNDLPHYATEGSAGMDLRANLLETVVLEPLERKLIPTGIFLEIPQGYEVQVRPRSGLALKNGITCLNSPGTIDSDYRGEVNVLLINLSNQPFTINNNDRIAQMVVAKVEHAALILVQQLNKTERNAGGFGHTGI